jgi:hypothetical protein
VTAPLTMSFDVACSAEHAFTVWTSGDRADATEVRVRFVARGATATRIEIEHRGWERLGAAGDEWRDRNQAGWQSLLPHFAAAATTGETR